MNRSVTINDKTYQLLKLLGHGKGGYSYLAEHEGTYVVIKQIHHEPCDYYQFGDKMQSELRDYERLKNAGIRIPELYAADIKQEMIVKEYIEGETILDLLKKDISVEKYLVQVKEMAELAKDKGLNIDYFPTNFVVKDGMIWYVDYECNDYSEEWNFENWGNKYWRRTADLEEYLRNC